VIAGNVSEESLGGDLAVSSLKDGAEAGIPGGLNQLVVEEGVAELRVHIRVVGVVLVVPDVDHVCCVVHTVELLVGEGAPAEVDHHGAVLVQDGAGHIVHIVGELDGVSEDPHPGLAKVGNVGLDRVGAFNVVHYLLTYGDANLGDGCQAANKTKVANVSELVAARFI
jgi:hypothetical protein